MSIFARSPFIVTIAESGQEGSKVELRIWNGTGSAPTDPQYTLSKLIPASNNVNTYYNISPYIREYLNFDERQTNWNKATIFYAMRGLSFMLTTLTKTQAQTRITEVTL